MKITLYTINDCQFSKQEKEFLTAHNLQFEEKNLETNKEYLTEMLAVSNNFAGTPVTKIEKDDGKIEVIKGFTPEEFNVALNLTPTAEPVVAQAQSTVAVPPPPPAPQSPAQRDDVGTPPAPEPTPPAPPTPEPPQTPPTPEPPTSEPTVPPEPTPAEPVIPPAPPTPIAPEPTPPPAPSEPDAMSSILNDLKEKSAEPTAPVAAPASSMPNIPDFAATT